MGKTSKGVVKKGKIQRKTTMMMKNVSNEESNCNICLVQLQTRVSIISNL